MKCSICDWDIEKGWKYENKIYCEDCIKEYFDDTRYENLLEEFKQTKCKVIEK